MLKPKVTGDGYMITPLRYTRKRGTPFGSIMAQVVDTQATSEIFNKALGFVLAVGREAANLGQAEVAERVGANRVTVSKWERGVAKPRDATLGALALLYSTNVERLVTAAAHTANRWRESKRVSREAITAILHNPSGDIGLQLADASELERLTGMAVGTKAQRDIARAALDAAHGFEGRPHSVAESPVEYMSRPGVLPVSRTLPPKARVRLQEFLLELAHAGATDAELDSAKAVLTAPEMFSFYYGGQPKDLTDEQLVLEMEAMMDGIREVLKRRGRKFGKK